MRPLIVYSDVSLDMFLVGPENIHDFTAGDRELGNEFTAEVMPRADTIIVGRKAFADMASAWPGSDGDVADWVNACAKVVLSSDPELDVSAWQNSTLAAGDGVEHVRRLKQTEGGGLITFGGALTVRSLVAADLVDEYWLKVSPTAVGSGGGVFADLPAYRPLKLRSVKAYPSGTLAVIYDR